MVMMMVMMMMMMLVIGGDLWMCDVGVYVCERERVGE